MFVSLSAWPVVEGLEVAAMGVAFLFLGIAGGVANLYRNRLTSNRPISPIEVASLPVLFLLALFFWGLAYQETYLDSYHIGLGLVPSGWYIVAILSFTFVNLIVHLI